MTRLHFPYRIYGEAGRRSSRDGIVERRALEALAEYQSRFDRARAEASGTFASLIQTFPNHEAQAKELFETSQFQALVECSANFNVKQGDHRSLNFEVP